MQDNFVKVFNDSRVGQVVVVIKDTNDDLAEIEFIARPETFGTCSFSVPGLDKRDAKAILQSINQANVKSFVDSLFSSIEYCQELGIDFHNVSS